MKLALRGLVFIGLVAVAALALLVLFPGLKEGASQEEVPALFGGVALFVLLGLVWWLVCGRSLKLSAGWFWRCRPPSISPRPANSSPPIWKAGGYRLCPPGEGSHTAFRTCYCRKAGT